MSMNKKTREIKTIQDLEPHFSRLFATEPILSALATLCSRRMTNVIPTAAIAYFPEEDTYTLLFNPEFFSKLADEEIIAVLKHELYHMLFLHPFEREKDLEVQFCIDIRNDPVMKDLCNFATDLAINSLIDDLPEGALIPGKGMFKEYESGKSTEYYFGKLLKDYKENKIQIVDLSTLDIHNWEELNKSTEEAKNSIAKKKILDALKEAIKKAQKTKFYGSVSEEIIKQLQEKYFNDHINWRALLRQFVGNSRDIELQTTIKRISKKAPYLMPGFKRNTICKVCAFVDNSGSMEDNDVVDALSTIANISTVTEVEVYNFDTKVDLNSKQIIKRGQKPKFVRTLCGGTSFHCIAEFLNNYEKKFNCIVIITDGYAELLKPSDYKGKIVWIITEDGTTDVGRENDVIVRIKK